MRLYNFSYRKDSLSQSISLKPGTYKFTTWGASSGSDIRGGFTSGTIAIKEWTLFYVFVGGKGEPVKLGSYSKGGSNGGGKGGMGIANCYSGAGGGGATDIRTIDDSSAYDSRIIVSGGGGGSCGIYINHGVGGYGGGIHGCSSTGKCLISSGGSQTFGFSKGKGQNGRNGIPSFLGGEGNGGGGGGWFGGYSSQLSGDGTNSGGGGGSSYISGQNGCQLNPKYVFTDIIMKSGSESFPALFDTEGNGYATIALLHSFNSAQKQNKMYNKIALVILVVIQDS